MASIPVLVVAGFVLISGLLTHSFISLVTIHHWMKGRPVSPIDQVLTSLGVSRMLIPIVSCFDIFLSLYFHTETDLINRLNITAECLLLLVNYSSIWLAALFSVVFCLKIATFQNRFYLRLKVVVSQRTVHMIAASLLISLSYIGIVFWVRTSLSLTNSTKVIPTNSSQASGMNIKYMYLFMFGNIFPFLVYCAATVLLVISLGLHLRRMRFNNNSSVHLHGYYVAIRSLSFCFACYALHCASNLIALYYVSKIGILWFYIIFNAFPAIHSLFLIYKTAYLWLRVSQILSCTGRCL